MHLDTLPPWARTALTGADPEPVVDPPATPDPDVDREAEAGRKALALVRRQGIHNAITAHRGKGGDSHEWQDAETVYALVDLDKVEIDLDTGAVSGLDDQLDALAKAKPFLLKAAEVQPAGPQTTGTPPGSGNSGHHPHHMNAASYAAEAPGIYREVLGRLAGVTTN